MSFNELYKKYDVLLISFWGYFSLKWPPQLSNIGKHKNDIN